MTTTTHRNPTPDGAGDCREGFGTTLAIGTTLVAGDVLVGRSAQR